MGDPLESARYMLARAKLHSSEFKAHVKAFFDSRPYTHLIEEDPETGEQVGKSKLIKPMPAMLNGMAADAVGNFRAALDQSGFAVSVAAGGRGKKTYFPFGDTADQVRSLKATRCREIPDEIFAVMEAFKPYKGGNDVLWALNKLCNANKHRIICPAAVTNTAFAVTGARMKDATVYWPPVWDHAKNEFVIFRMKKGGYVDYNVEIADVIAFGEIDVFSNAPADGVLDAICSEVERVLMAVEAEARRIGLFK